MIFSDCGKKIIFVTRRERSILDTLRRIPHRVFNTLLFHYSVRK